MADEKKTAHKPEACGRDADESKKKEPVRLEPGMLLVLDGR